MTKKTEYRTLYTTYHSTKEEAAELVVEMRRRFFTHNELDRVTPDTVLDAREERKS